MENGRVWGKITQDSKVSSPGIRKPRLGELSSKPSKFQYEIGYRGPGRSWSFLRLFFFQSRLVALFAGFGLVLWY